jgi:hypothetical protein
MENTWIEATKDIGGKNLVSWLTGIVSMFSWPADGKLATKEGVGAANLKGSCISSLLSPSSP